MSLRDKILRELDVQAQHEGGDSPNIRQCRAIVSHVQTESEWRALVAVGHHRYGKLSYECHTFYYAKPWLVPMCTEILEAAR